MNKIEDYDFSKFDYNKKYHLHIDFDTPIFANAAVVSKDVCQVEHKTSGRKKTYKNFDEFSNWLNLPENFMYKLSDFNIPVVGFAIYGLNKQLKEMVSHGWVGDYTLYVGGDTNFRKDLYPDYKGNRAKSPAMRKVLFNYVVSKYKDKVVVSDGEEAEDACLSKVLEDIDSNVCGYCDKDLTTQSAYFFNYKKQEKGVFFIDEKKAFFNLCCQLLHGDRATDNIRGIDFVSKDLKDKFGIGSKSIGESTAEKLLDDVKHDVFLMKKRIIEIYQLSYGDSWKENLQFTGSLVFISKRQREYFDVEIFLKGVDYDT